MTENLPEHLREDIGAEGSSAGTEEEHLREDVNIPAEENDGGPEFSGEHFTSGQLNAGQEVPGLSPAGEYAAGREKELEERED